MLVYNIASAVVSCNRLPRLFTAVHRRVFVVLTAAYFDDIPVVDIAAGPGSAQVVVRSVLKAVGAAPTPAKGAPLDQYRHLLGTNIRLAGFAARREITSEPKSSTRRGLEETIKRHSTEQTLHPGDASKLR